MWGQFALSTVTWALVIKLRSLSSCDEDLPLLGHHAGLSTQFSLEVHLASRLYHLFFHYGKKLWLQKTNKQKQTNNNRTNDSPSYGIPKKEGTIMRQPLYFNHGDNGFLAARKKVGVHSELSSFSTQFNANDELKRKEHTCKALSCKLPRAPHRNRYHFIAQAVCQLKVILLPQLSATMA